MVWKTAERIHGCSKEGLVWQKRMAGVGVRWRLINHCGDP